MTPAGFRAIVPAMSWTLKASPSVTLPPAIVTVRLPGVAPRANV
jgi:hypothetical protein